MATQGVLLMHSVLTGQAAEAGSHGGGGGEEFPDAIVRGVAAKDDPVVFLLWGSYAQKKADFVQSVEQGGKHLVLKAPHPSPLSAHNGFFGCKHFSKTNDFLQNMSKAPIDWQLPEL